MRIGVPKETSPGEHRVALVPDSVTRLVKAGIEVAVERGAGESAFYSDDAYRSAGATLVEAEAAFSAETVVKVQRPSTAEVARLKPDAILISLLPALDGA